MHQGWPKFTQNLWYATPDNGLAALVYSPSEVTAKVANGITVKITEDTYYPVDDNIRFTLQIQDKKVKSVDFPFHVRIPSWAKEASIRVNGQLMKTVQGGKAEVISRTWKSGDNVELHFPMSIEIDNTWYENAVSVQRGPLVYALKIEEEWVKKEFDENEKKQFGDSYWEVYPKTPWNYGILQFDKNKADETFCVQVNQEKIKENFFWNPENAPVELKVKAKAIPSWKLYNEMAGPLPFSTSQWADEPEQEITLIPYGCTTLRISQFPLVR